MSSSSHSCVIQLYFLWIFISVVAHIVHIWTYVMVLSDKIYRISTLFHVLPYEILWFSSAIVLIAENECRTVLVNSGMLPNIKINIRTSIICCWACTLSQLPNEHNENVKLRLPTCGWLNKKTTKIHQLPQPNQMPLHQENQTNKEWIL